MSDREKRAAALEVFSPLREKSRPAMRWASARASAAFARASSSFKPKASESYESATSTTIGGTTQETSTAGVSLEDMGAAKALYDEQVARCTRRDSEVIEHEVQEELTNLRKQLEIGSSKPRVPAPQLEYIQRQRSKSDADANSLLVEGLPSPSTRPIVRRNQTTRQFMEDSKKAAEGGLGV